PPDAEGRLRDMVHNPAVPETLEGWSLLHLMYRVNWGGLRRLGEADLQGVVDAFASAAATPEAGPTAFVQMLGHKADLMLICFRRDFDALAQAQRALAGTDLFDHLEPTASYVSVVELGMYEMT